MFGWPVLLAWLIALVLGAGIAAFAGYETLWRLGRLGASAAQLDEALAGLRELAALAEQTRQRAAGIRPQPAATSGPDRPPSAPGR
ncbi:MAG: hypothetical protein LBQ06_03935 [Frankiaceae bacterium]|nr:hypothetical protein [Frankiaceae bacterium]